MTLSSYGKHFDVLSFWYAVAALSLNITRLTTCFFIFVFDANISYVYITVFLRCNESRTLVIRFWSVVVELFNSNGNIVCSHLFFFVFLDVIDVDIFVRSIWCNHFLKSDVVNLWFFIGILPLLLNVVVGLFLILLLYIVF